MGRGRCLLRSNGQSRAFEAPDVKEETIRNHKIARSLATVAVSLAATLAPAWAQFTGSPVPGQNLGSEKALTGIVSDSYCKGQHSRKGQTQFSCTLKCVHEEGREYILVVGNDVYVLNGPRVELDKFAGGRATITGNLSDGTLTVEQVTVAKKVVPLDHL